tara:strand:+ start:1450 stop:2295 length:846 start_codon:yes stop_codon:yes gene_type:complete
MTVKSALNEYVLRRKKKIKGKTPAILKRKKLKKNKKEIENKKENESESESEDDYELCLEKPEKAIIEIKKKEQRKRKILQVFATTSKKHKHLFKCETRLDLLDKIDKMSDNSYEKRRQQIKEISLTYIIKFQIKERKEKEIEKKRTSALKKAIKAKQWVHAAKLAPKSSTFLLKASVKPFFLMSKIQSTKKSDIRGKYVWPGKLPGFSKKAIEKIVRNFCELLKFRVKNKEQIKQGLSIMASENDKKKKKKVAATRNGNIFGHRRNGGGKGKKNRNHVWCK